MKYSKAANYGNLEEENVYIYYKGGACSEQQYASRFVGMT